VKNTEICCETVTPAGHRANMRVKHGTIETVGFLRIDFADVLLQWCSVTFVDVRNKTGFLLLIIKCGITCKHISIVHSDYFIQILISACNVSSNVEKKAEKSFALCGRGEFDEVKVIPS